MGRVSYASVQKRLRRDRKMILATLRDYANGKLSHLPRAEARTFVASLLKRVNDIEAEIEGELD